MNIKRIIISVLILLLAVVSFYAASGNISASRAQATANSFIKSHFKTSPGSYRAPAMADIVLAYAEPSDEVANANCYYVFNIKGGGFIIVSGEDQATPILGYSDRGQLNINNLPDPLKDLLGEYKADIELLLAHEIVLSNSFNQSFGEAVTILEPMMKTTWGPHTPYNIMCPTLNGQYSKVGCAGVGMAQTLYFWRFPVSCDSLPAYFSSRLNDTVPALPSTVFDYDKMLLSYSHWGENGLVQDVYTEEQAHEVAKLCRYCGQSIQMNYSPSGSGPLGSRPTALKKMGYNSNARTIYRSSYSDDVWVELLKADLNAGIPIQYTGSDAASSAGHVFILDGYDSEDFFHMNMGWYGHADGWYQISAIILTNLNGQRRNYKNKNSFIQGLEPPLFCTIDAVVSASSGLHFLGETLTALASDVKLSMSYRTLPFMFSLTDLEGEQVALSESVTLNRLTFENGTDISLALTLPETLPNGTYDLRLNYCTGDNESLTPAITASDQLYVLGKFAKFGAPFGIADVTELIDMILQEVPQVNIADVTMLIDYLLYS